MSAIVHTAEAILAELRRGSTPLTDNVDALRALGFERTYPQITTGYESTIWERAVDSEQQSGAPRMLVRERALLTQDGK